MLSEKMQYLLDDAISPFLENFAVEYDPGVIVMATNLKNKKIRKNEAFNFFCILNDQLDKSLITI